MALTRIRNNPPAYEKFQKSNTIKNFIKYFISNFQLYYFMVAKALSLIRTLYWVQESLFLLFLPKLVCGFFTNPDDKSKELKGKPVGLSLFLQFFRLESSP